MPIQRSLTSSHIAVLAKYGRLHTQHAAVRWPVWTIVFENAIDGPGPGYRSHSSQHRLVAKSTSFTCFAFFLARETLLIGFAIHQLNVYTSYPCHVHVLFLQNVLYLVPF